MRTQNDRLAHPQNPGSATANSVTSLNKPTLMLKAHIMFHVWRCGPPPPPHASSSVAPVQFSSVSCSLRDPLQSVQRPPFVMVRCTVFVMIWCTVFDPCYCTMLHLHQPIHSDVVYATVIIYYHQYFVPCCWLFVNNRPFSLFFSPFAAFITGESTFKMHHYDMC